MSILTLVRLPRTFPQYYRHAENKVGLTFSGSWRLRLRLHLLRITFLAGLVVVLLFLLLILPVSAAASRRLTLAVAAQRRSL